MDAGLLSFFQQATSNMMVMDQDWTNKQPIHVHRSRMCAGPFLSSARPRENNVNVGEVFTHTMCDITRLVNFCGNVQYR